ncbi:hypothetical protein [Mariniphaga sp.]|uniref:hypothetical protein n=1 Tax=Mariniphaga sp. TaxID=1954475 RepID=UPI0035674898
MNIRTLQKNKLKKPTLCYKTFFVAEERGCKKGKKNIRTSSARLNIFCEKVFCIICRPIYRTGFNQLKIFFQYLIKTSARLQPGVMC